jgi:hypothetical protein
MTSTNDTLKKIVAYNEKLLDAVDGDQGSVEGLIELDDKKSGISIWNPFLDTTFRTTVDPVKEYGEEAVTEMISKYNLKRLMDK